MRKPCVSCLSFPILLLATWQSALGNSPPVVSNVTASQRQDGSKLVDIWYSLADADGDACTVSIAASNDAGATWGVTARSLTGAVGLNISPGDAKLIVWDCKADQVPTGVRFKIRVCANDVHIAPAMVLIPAGEFQMGDTFSEGESNERPVHAVYVDPFYIDHTEVTNQQYADALNWADLQGNLCTLSDGVIYKYNDGTAHPYYDTALSSSNSHITWNGTVFSITPGREDHPVTMVSWYGAAAYANWRSEMQGLAPCYELSTWECNFGSGYRLPTEAEWEKAARGGATGHRFPWSDSDEIQHARAIYYSSPDYPYDTSPTRGYHPKFNMGMWPNTSPVGYFAPNGYGVHDTTGNVWEWCNDWYGGSYYWESPHDNPLGPAVGGGPRVIRGGDWDNVAFLQRCASRSRDYPDRRYRDHGFRLARGAQ